MKSDMERSIKKLQIIDNTTLAKHIKNKRLERVFSNSTISDYEEDEILGEGGFSTVWQATRLNDGLVVAIKDLEKRNASTKRDAVLREIYYNIVCRHRNVVTMLEAFEDIKYYHIVMERCSHDLRTIRDHEQVTDDLIRRIVRHLCSGLKHMHDQNIVHRDLKLDNIMVCGDVFKISDCGDVFKISDLGKASYERWFHGLTTNMEYAAIEIVESMNPKKKSERTAPEIVPYKGKPADIWAFGVIIYELVYVHSPFIGDSDLEIMNNIKTNAFLYKLDRSNPFDKLIENMLNRDVGQRFTVDEIHE
jgi:serine/threonine protein kinase